MQFEIAEHTASKPLAPALFTSISTVPAAAMTFTGMQLDQSNSEKITAGLNLHSSQAARNFPRPRRCTVHM